jgi:hypothetical protein
MVEGNPKEAFAPLVRGKRNGKCFYFTNTAEDIGKCKWIFLHGNVNTERNDHTGDFQTNALFQAMTSHCAVI